MSAPPAEQALLALLDAPEGARIENLRRLSGGANMETWSLDLVEGAASEALILRREPGSRNSKTGDSSEVGELTLAEEAALLEVAGRHGVAVPALRRVLSEADGLGRGYIMSREPGEALPFKLLVEECYRDALAGLARRCGEELARIHEIPLDELPAGVPDHGGALLFERAQALLDDHDNVSPVLQLGLNWLRDNARGSPRRTLVHGDFRMGNLLVDTAGLSAVLDWELAHLGDPVQDLGYLCANVWRFNSPLPVGGFGEYADLLAGYESVAGWAPPMADVRYWEVHAALSWGMVCLVMLQMYRSGSDASLERSAVGRRLSEAEIDLLVLLEGEDS